MQDRQEVEQWRIDAFQIYLPASSCLDPFPDDGVAELSREFFKNPYDAYAAVCNETDQWKAYEKAANALVRETASFAADEGCIDMMNVRDELESYIERAREGLMQDIRMRVESVLRDGNDRKNSRGR